MSFSVLKVCRAPYSCWSGCVRGRFTRLKQTLPDRWNIASPPQERGSPAGNLVVCRCFGTHPVHAQKEENVMNVFDRKTKRIQRNLTARMKDYESYDYIKEEMGYRMADRVLDIKRTFPVAVDVGCGRGHIAKNVYADTIGVLYQCDMAEDVLAQAASSPEVPTYKVHCDEEFLPFKAESLDLVMSSMSLHWVNDLPGVFKQIHRALKSDGCLLGAMFGADTLYELRVSLQLAEQEIEGGISPHISPFTSVQDLGNLMNRTGFNMLTIDVDQLKVNFPSIHEVMRDIKGMGENNCAWSRKLRLNRKTLQRAGEIYKEMYGTTEEGEECVTATFHVLNFIGWKADKSQAQPAKRGSGQISLKDIGRLDQMAKQIEDLKSQVKGSEGLDQTLDHLTEQMEKLKAASKTENEEDPKRES